MQLTLKHKVYLLLDPYKLYSRLSIIILLVLVSQNGITREKKVDSLTGKVIKILDGDTYDILNRENKTFRIRMEGIDAPEKGMPFYNVSKKYLGSLCYNKIVRVEISNYDFHGRIVAYTFLNDGREMSYEMIKAGLAWHFKKYSSDTTLANLEKVARSLKLGIWIDKNPMPPWENRRLHRVGISTKNTFDFKN